MQSSYFAVGEIESQGGKQLTRGFTIHSRPKSSIKWHPKMWLWEFRTCHPKIYHFAISIILWCGLLKDSKCRWGFPQSPLIFQKVDSPKGTQLSSVAFPEFHQLGKIKILSQERSLEVDTTHRHTLPQTIITPIYSSKGPFIFYPNHLLSHKRPTSLSPFPVKMVFHPEF